jgi:hypothetical protein
MALMTIRHLIVFYLSEKKIPCLMTPCGPMGPLCVRVTLLVAGAAVVTMMMAVSLVATVSGALALFAMTVVICASYPRNQLYNRGLAFSAFWVSETSPFA